MSCARDRLPIVRPALPPLEEVVSVLRGSYESGQVTVGRVVRALEEEARAATGARHAVAMSSCTSGLILAWRALDLPPGGEVICPSFTFAATAHAIVWSGLVPVFVDCLPESLVVDPAEVERALSPRTVAVCPAYVFGLPPDMEDIAGIARRKGLPVVSDSAQGLGATYRGRPAGTLAAVEVFSMSPTKVITSIEGGLVTTDDPALASRLESLRDYGKALEGPLALEDMIQIGLSARLSELHAAVGLLNLRRRDDLVRSRLRLVDSYRRGTEDLPGCSHQDWPGDRTSNGNYFVLFVGEGARRSRDEVRAALEAQGIQTKRYFHPPVHLQTAQRRFPMRTVGDLPQTLRASAEALALPLYSDMKEEEQARVVDAVRALLAS